MNTQGPTTPVARYWHVLDDGRVQCDVCPRACRLRDGQRGFCFVRANEGGRLVLTTWGRSSGLCVDPIEKKPLYHFLPGTSVLSFGTAGCNLACRYCQNWELSHARSAAVSAVEVEPAAVATAAVGAGCPSVAFTYNDPVVFLEYAVDVARACRARRVRTVAVTNGYLCAEPRRELFAHLDAANVDLKAFTERFYRELTGGHLRPVLDTLEYAVHETDVWIELTTLLIPGHNDDPREIDALTRWVVGHLGPHVPVHFTAFHPAGRMLDVPRTPLSTLQRARHIARANGLRTVYTGNVVDPEGSRTVCPWCGSTLIERSGFAVVRRALADDGSCERCGATIDGVFEAVG